MILTRSPYYYNQVLTSQFVDAITLELSIQKRNGTALEEIDNIEFTKARPSSDNTNLFIDVSPNIRDYYTFSPISLSELQTGGLIVSREGEVLVSAATIKERDTLGTDFTGNTIITECTDGHGYYLEGQNPQPPRKTLLSHSNYKMDANGYFIIPFYEVSESEILTINGNAVALGSNNTLTDKYKYLIIQGSSYTGNITVNYDGESTIIELITECKYEVKEIQFINRFGMLESLHFYKTKKDSISTKSTKFKNAYTNGVSYDVLNHQIKEYNKTSNKSTTIETGFLNEDYNLTMQELIESEHVWLREGSVISPVNVKTSSLQFKTRIVDKLISYSIEFEYAFDEINNV